MRFPSIYMDQEKKQNQIWLSYILGLFQQYKFNYENFNKFFAEPGVKTSGYPMADGQIADHHLTLEAYHYYWVMPLKYITNEKETFPLLFSEENFFEQGCKGEFGREQKYPIYHELHKKYFTKEFFQTNDLPISLLELDFGDQFLNFCLRIFWTAILLLGIMQDIFLELDKWEPINGENVKKLDSFQLNLLAFLYLTFHPTATLLCYGLYRNKYGIKTNERTTIYFQKQGQFYALKDYLKVVVKEYIENAPETKAKAAVALAEMFGVGYTTSAKKKENVHLNTPYAFGNYVVEHNPKSPLWRLFYEFGGEWWSREEMDQIVAGKGEHWEKWKTNKRALFVHYCHQYAAKYWQENLEKLPKEFKKAKEYIGKSIGLALNLI
ncbi:hypothetical protein ACFL2K_02830 [Candidatus Margulisiibacteriota bacterium]